MAPLVALVIAASVVACDALPRGSDIPASEVGAKAADATFVVAASGGLFAFDAGGRLLGRIAKLPPNSVPSSPAFDPHARVIAFALTRMVEGLPVSSDIYRVNVDGTDLRIIVEHERQNVFYASPAFDPTGRALFVGRRAFDPGNLQHPADSRVADTLERIDLDSAERRTVLVDAADPSVSPDGKALVFVHMTKGYQDGLWTAGVDGGAPRPFLKTRDAFILLQAPRVSPSGREVVLCSAGHVVTRGSSGGPRYAHLGAMSELFIAPIDGTALRSFAVIADDVVPAWSRDGTRIAYIALGTLFVVRAVDGAVLMKPNIDVTYGDPVWLR